VPNKKVDVTGNSEVSSGSSIPALQLKLWLELSLS